MKKKGEARKLNAKKIWGLIGYAAALTVWVFCVVVASQLIAGIIMGFFITAEQLQQPMWSGITYLISYIIEIPLIIFVPHKLMTMWRSRNAKKTNDKEQPISREELGLKELPTWVDLGLAPVGFIMSTVAALGLTWFFSFFQWFNAVETQVSLEESGFTPYMNNGEKIIAFLTLVIAAPIVEELVFRGWLYGKLRAKLNVVASILIVSVLFGIMHFQWNVGVNVFALSVVCCVLREITGTIYAGILTHMIKNGVAFYLLYVLGFG